VRGAGQLGTRHVLLTNKNIISMPPGGIWRWGAALGSGARRTCGGRAGGATCGRRHAPQSEPGASRLRPRAGASICTPASAPARAGSAVGRGAGAPPPPHTPPVWRVPPAGRQSLQRAQPHPHPHPGCWLWVLQRGCKRWQVERPGLAAGTRAVSVADRPALAARLGVRSKT
jgi:hypothetical protein